MTNSSLSLEVSWPTRHQGFALREKSLDLPLGVEVLPRCSILMNGNRRTGGLSCLISSARLGFGKGETSCTDEPEGGSDGIGADADVNASADVDADADADAGVCTCTTDRDHGRTFVRAGIQVHLDLGRVRQRPSLLGSKGNSGRFPCASTGFGFDGSLGGIAGRRYEWSASRRLVENPDSIALLPLEDCDV